jgi:hypothetical protein
LAPLSRHEVSGTVIGDAGLFRCKTTEAGNQAVYLAEPVREIREGN